MATAASPRSLLATTGRRRRLRAEQRCSLANRFDRDSLFGCAQPRLHCSCAQPRLHLVSSPRQGRKSHSRLSRLPSQDGGATYTRDNDLIVTDSTISDCRAVQGGAVYVQSGSASLARSNISNCIATESGGGLFFAGGRTTLSDGTLVSGCSAPKGSSVFLLAGEVSYALPAPAGPPEPLPTTHLAHDQQIKFEISTLSSKFDGIPLLKWALRVFPR